MRLLRIPAGSFRYGSDPPEGNADEWPARVLATSGFEIAETPVTVAEFAPFVEQRGYWLKDLWTEDGWDFRMRGRIEAPRFWGDPAWSAYLEPSHPVVGVSWYEADAFARFCRMRLPTEVEWERAARGEDGRRYPWGDDWDPAKAHHRGQERHTLPVRSRNLSPHGLWDCAGNVWEWCADTYALGLRSARGGSWNAHPPQLRCAARNAWPEHARYSNLGFRLAR